jgi:beta-phosphoglucomutase-like phosphatase (HAD superfamily)
VDSGKVGVEKPDPRIFRIACEQTGTTEARGLHLGDTFATDVLGAQAAGMRTALIDPHGHYEGLYPEVPRVVEWLEVAASVPGFVGFAVGRTTFWDAVAAFRSGDVTRDEAVRRVAKRFSEWSTIFERPRAHDGGARWV